MVKQFGISEIATAANLLAISQGKTVFYSVLGKLPPRKIVSPPSPNPKANPKPNPDPDLGAIFRTAFYSFQYKNGWLAASDLFDMFAQSVKFIYTFCYHKYR